MIKYHEYRTGERDYGDDHKLTNNWNPEQDYGKEYAKVGFNMESEGYCYPSFSFTEEQREKFTDDINKIFSSIGWTCEEPERKLSGVCATWRKGKSHLYMHPQQFSGEVLKNDIKEVAEALQSGTVFSLRWVDIWETVYDISDEEYHEYLHKKEENIRTDLYSNFGTTRRNKYYYTYEVVQCLLKKYGLKRIAVDNDKVGNKFIMDIISNMSKNGLIVTERDFELIRSLNKTEKKHVAVV